MADNQATPQVAEAATNSPTFDLSSFNSEIVNTEIGKARPGTASNASEGAAQNEPAKAAPKSAPENPAATQEGKEGGAPADGANDGSAPEVRLSAAQRKIHEQAEALKMLQRELSESKGQLTQKQLAVFDAILEQQKKASEPKTPSIEDVEKQFNEAVEKSPFQAVMLAVQAALGGKSAQGQQLTQDEVKKIASDIATGVVGQATVRQTIDANCIALKTKHPTFDADFDQFSGSLWKEYGFLGDRAQEAVMSVMADPARLDAKYTAYLYMTKGADAFAKKTAAEEAAVAVKIMQSPGNGRVGDVKREKGRMVKEDITPGFSSYW